MPFQGIHRATLLNKSTLSQSIQTLWVKERCRMQALWDLTPAHRERHPLPFLQLTMHAGTQQTSGQRGLHLAIGLHLGLLKETLPSH
jgi:hypothetical protein